MELEVYQERLVQKANCKGELTQRLVSVHVSDNKSKWKEKKDNDMYGYLLFHDAWAGIEYMALKHFSVRTNSYLWRVMLD